jgi:hypothetical protein
VRAASPEADGGLEDGDAPVAVHDGDLDSDWTAHDRQGQPFPVERRRGSDRAGCVMASAAACRGDPDRQKQQD